METELKCNKCGEKLGTIIDDFVDSEIGIEIIIEDTKPVMIKCLCGEIHSLENK